MFSWAGIRQYWGVLAWWQCAGTRSLSHPSDTLLRPSLADWQHPSGHDTPRSIDSWSLVNPYDWLCRAAGSARWSSRCFPCTKNKQKDALIHHYGRIKTGRRFFVKMNRRKRRRSAEIIENLRANGAGKHYRRDVKGRETEVKVGLIFSLHDVHVDQVLCIALLDCY